MIKFLLKSYKKLLKAFGVCFGIFYVVMTCLLVILALSKNDIDSFLTMEGFVLQVPIFCFIITCMVLVVAFLSEYREHRRQLVLFEKPPFADLLSLGFETKYLFENSLWKLKKVIHMALIDGFMVVADVQPNGVIVFSILTRGTIPADFEFMELPNQTKSFSDNAGIGLMIEINSYRTPTVRQMLELFRQLIIRLAKNGYLPAQDVSQYEGRIVREMIAKEFMQ